MAWRGSPTRALSLFNAVVRSLHAVYPVTESIAQRAGMLRGQFQAQGIAHSTPDMLIAATTQQHLLFIATRNVLDFKGCGVQVVNSFERVE